MIKVRKRRLSAVSSPSSECTFPLQPSRYILERVSEGRDGRAEKQTY